MAAKAFSPGNITLFFMISPHKNPLKMGSLGLSFAVNKGAWATAERSKVSSVYLNGKKESFPTLNDGIRHLADRPVMVKIKTELPLGAGFGMSGACTLAALLAINEELGLGKSRRELALIAHKSEVRHRTGLGSVTAEFLGGPLMRNRPGNPLAAEQLPLPAQTFFYRSFKKMSTKEKLKDRRLAAACELAFSSALEKTKRLLREKKLTWASLFRIGKEFCLASWLLPTSYVTPAINSIERRGGAATMALLGKAVIATKPFPGSRAFSVSHEGARIIE